MTRLDEPVTAAPDPPQPEAAAPAAAAPPRGRPLLAWLAVIVVVGGAVLGSNMFSVRDRLLGSAVPGAAAPVASRDAFTAVARTAPAPSKLRSQAWWQDVATRSSTGTATVAPFTIADDAIQWRLKASCGSGRIVVRAPGQAKPILDAACSKQGTVAYANRSGATRLTVQADGPWRLAVSQQIDAPLVEPPLPAMSAPATRKVATGTFYNVDKTGKGSVTVYRHADGRYSLRLDRFFVTPTSDLEVRLSTRRAPRTTRDYTSAHSRLVATMDVTAGSLNYLVPAGVDPRQFGSIAIWCAATANVYGAASLEAIG